MPKQCTHLVPCLRLKTTSLKIEANMSSRQLHCLAAYELTIGFPESDSTEIDLTQKLDFHLYAKQLEISDISVELPTEYEGVIELVDKVFLPPEKQAIALKHQKALKLPCGYMSMVHGIKEIQDKAQEIQLLFKMVPDKLKSTRYEDLKQLEDQLQFKLKITYCIKQSIAGLRYLLNKVDVDQTDTYLVTEKHMHSSRSWMPVPFFIQQKFPPYCHQVKELLYFKKIILITDMNYLAICSGKLVEQLEFIDNPTQRGFIYDLSTFINPDDIGIFVGRWKHFQVSLDDQIKFQVMHNYSQQQHLQNLLQSEQCKQVFEQVDRFWYKESLLQTVRDTLHIDQGFFNGLTLIIIPTIYQQTYLSFYPFANLLIFDEIQIPAEIPCQRTQADFMKCLLLQLNTLSLKQFVAPSSELSDRWIEIGFAFQSSWADDYEHLHKDIINQIVIGQDVILEQQIPFVVESEQYQLKARIVMAMLARVTHQPEKFIKDILRRFYQDYKGTIPAPLSTNVIFSSIKKVFCIAKCKFMRAMFIRSMGAWKFNVQYNYSKDHKLNFTIMQTPMTAAWASEYTKHRILGEKSANFRSECGDYYQENLDRIKQITKAIQKLQKDKENQMQDQIKQQQKAEQKEIDNQYQHLALIPQELDCPMYFSGQIRIKVSETNELKMENQTRELQISAKYCNQQDVNCPLLLKKFNISKRHLEINAQSYLEKDNKNGLMEIENENSIQPPMIHGILGEALMKSGALIKRAKILSEQIQKEPPYWIKWDPEGFLIKEVEYKNQDEVVVLCQVMKEQDLNQIVTIVKNIKKQGLRETVLKLLVELVETSYAFLDSNLIVQLIGLMVDLVNRNSEKRMDQGYNDFEDLDELLMFLKLAEKITYRYFYNQYDNSVKYYKFTNFGEYDVVISLFKGLGKLITTGSLGFHQELTQLLYVILERYDNSQNHYDCSYLTAQLLKLLMNSNCNQSKFKVLLAILHELKKAIQCNTPKNYILKTIIVHYAAFVEINFSEQFQGLIQQTFEKVTKEISDTIEYHRSVTMKTVQNNYLKLAYFKVYLQEQFQKYEKNPYHLVLHCLHTLTKLRLKQGSTTVLFQLKLQAVTKFMAKKYRIFAKQLSRTDIKPEVLKMLSLTAFECVITGPSLLNHNIQSNFASIYRILYYYFAPLDQVQLIKDKLPQISNMLLYFEYDQLWVESHMLHLEEEIAKLKTNITQQQAKRARPVSKTQHLDIYQKLQKFAMQNPGRVSEKDMGKYILKLIMGMPQVKSIEDQLKENGSIPQLHDSQFQSKGQSKLEHVRASMKRKFQSMDQVHKQIVSALGQYTENGLMDQISYNEMLEESNKIFIEGRKVMDQVRESNMQKKNTKVIVKLEEGIQEVEQPSTVFKLSKFE